MGCEAKPSVTSQGLWAIATQAMILMASVAGAVILNRVLQPEGRGIVGLVMLWPPLLANVGAAGWANANVWYVSRNRRQARAVWSSTTLAGLVVSAALIGMGYFLMPLALSAHSATWPLARWYLLVIPALFLQMASTSVLEGLGLFSWTAWIRAGNVIAATLMLLGLYLSGHLLPSTYIAGIFVVTVAIMVVGAAMVASVSRGSWWPEFKQRPAFALSAAPYACGTSIQTYLDQLLIVALMPASVVSFGVYLASVNVGRLLSPASVGLAMVLLPASSDRSPEASVDLLCRSVRLYLIGVFALMTPLAAAAPQILTFAFGEAYAGGANLLRLALVAAAVTGPVQFGVSVIQGQGRPAVATLVGLVSLATSLVAGIALLLLVGYSGALVGQCIGAMVGWMLIGVCSSPRIRLAQLIPTRADWAVVAGGLARLPRRFTTSPQAGRP